MRRCSPTLKPFGIGIAAVLLAMLAACGGGSGDGNERADGSGSGAPVAPPSGTDRWPVGAKIDLRHKQYFPARPGDTWRYVAHDYPHGIQPLPGTTPTGGFELVRTVTAADGDRFVIEESGGPDGPSSERYRRDADGLYTTIDFGADAPAALQAAIGELLAYPDPFFAIGESREHVREGEIGEDVDGDGRSERFQLTLTQVLRGFETVLLPEDRITDAARFHTSATLTLHYTRPPALPPTQITNEVDEWFAPGLGLVKAEARSTVSAPVIPGREENLRTMLLSRATLDGVDYTGRPIDGTSALIDLVHNGLVHDPVRNRYYASLPAGAANQANRIAIIDPDTGRVVSTTRVIGTDPDVMAISADGSSLYVGLAGSGEVVRLRLPDFGEISRTRLAGEDSLPLGAASIAVSPTDPAVAAVVMYRLDAIAATANEGVALLHNGVRLPRVADGSGRYVSGIAFTADGGTVAGYAPEGWLRWIRIEADGLGEDDTLSLAAPRMVYDGIDAAGDRLLIGSTVIDRGSLQTIGQLGATPNALCRWQQPASRIACIPRANAQDFGSATPPEQRLQRFEAPGLTAIDAPVFSGSTQPRQFTRLVAVPGGQVAIGIRHPDQAGRHSTQILLFRPTSP